MTAPYLYQRDNRYFAQTGEDVKTLARQELQQLGADDIKVTYRGLFFTALPAIMYAINYNTRLINRILAPLIVFDCRDEKILYKTAYDIPWEDFLTSADTFAVYGSVGNSTIRHSQFAALKVKDAIADRFRRKTGQRPSVDTRSADVRIHLYIMNNKATLSIDTSGGSLHRRGYRKAVVEAPMQETVAAAMIAFSGWNKATPLIDPFCGSGTILCEAYMAATRMPAATLRRRFGFMRLPDFHDATWQKVKKKYDAGLRPIKAGLISGSDLSHMAVRASAVNLEALAAKQFVTVKPQDFFRHDALKGKTIICNPPYGLRMAKDFDKVSFYRNVGDFLKQKCSGSTAFIYFGDRSLIKQVGLRPNRKIPLENGGLDGRLVKYELY
ncbi:MAG: class I SAM-dependent RNA methyltransferase [Fidelibacterota bacterium]